MKKNMYLNMRFNTVVLFEKEPECDDCDGLLPYMPVLKLNNGKQYCTRCFERISGMKINPDSKRHFKIQKGNLRKEDKKRDGCSASCENYKIREC